jgi:hypothetical protein
MKDVTVLIGKVVSATSKITLHTEGSTSVKGCLRRIVHSLLQRLLEVHLGFSITGKSVE